MTTNPEIIQSAHKLADSMSDLAVQINETAAVLANLLDTLAESETPLTPVPTPQVPASSRPLGFDSPSLKLVLEDTFDAPTLSRGWRRGRPANAAGGHHGYAYDDKVKEIGYYLGHLVTVENGRAVLTANSRKLVVKQDRARQGLFVSGGSVLADTFYSPEESGTWPYQTATMTSGPDSNGWSTAMEYPKPDGSAGSVWTKLPPSMAIKYGAVEASIRVPKGKGFWPAMWLMPVDGTWSYEIDVAEWVDPEARRVAQHLHANNGAIDLTNAEGLGLDMRTDLSAGFHTYAIDWSPTYLRWYVDGKMTQEITRNIPNTEMYLIFNLAIGGWGGLVAPETQFPARMEIDYVKAWSRS